MKTNKNILITAILLIVGMVLVVPASAELQWDITTVDTGSFSGYYSSLAFNETSNQPAISYHANNEYLKYAWKDNSGWSKCIVDQNEGKNTGGHSSLAFFNGNPAISYQVTGAPASLMYASKTGDNAWENMTLEGEELNVGYYTSLAFNNSGNPSISYGQWEGGNLKYAWLNGTKWNYTVIDNTIDTTKLHSSLAFNTSTDYPAISYWDSENNLKYAWHNGSGWSNMIVDTDGAIQTTTSLAFDSEGNPAISYGSSGKLNYASKVDGEWVITEVDTSGSLEVGEYSSLAFNRTSDNPAISYTWDDGSYALKYAWSDGEEWSKMTVDNSGSVGTHNSLAFDANGIPAISYRNESNGNLKYAYGAVLPPTTISVTSSPAGATIYLNGAATGEVTPFDLTTGLTAGTYNVTVILDGYEPGINNSVNVVENETTSVHFDLEPIPDVNFTATPLTGTNPLTVQFNDTTNIDCFDWEWDFGDGTTVFNEQNPVHIYNATGVYTVTLTVGSEYLMDEESEVPGSDEPNRKTKIDYITVTDPAPSPTPTQVIHRGGGGGGDSQFEFKEGTGILLTSDEGKILHKTIYISRDGIAKLTLGQNIFARGSDGEPIPKITIEPINASEVPSNPNGTFTFAGLAYRCTPSGATFSPAIILSLTLSADEWDALGEGDFSIRFYDEKTKEWIELPVTVDHENHTITAKITHFSIFGLFTSTGSATTIAQAQPTVTPGITVSTDALTETQGGTTTASEPTKSAPLVCVPLIGLGALAILRKRL